MGITSTYPFQVRSFSSQVATTNGLKDMVSGTRRKYFMVGGKGGVGKTSCAVSLAIKFANNDHPTIVVSTNPAHSLSDSFDQDLAGGTFVHVQGVDSSLFALESNPKTTWELFHGASQNPSNNNIKDMMNSMGLGVIANQLADLKLGELLDTLPPGVDEVIAISQVMEFLESGKYDMFTRIVFATISTFKNKISLATSAIKSVFPKEDPPQDFNDKLEKLRERVANVRDLFHDSELMEFVIVTTPTDQMRALELIQKDPELSTLKSVQAPLIDVEVRGVPALKFIGDLIWR